MHAFDDASAGQEDGFADKVPQSGLSNSFCCFPHKRIIADTFSQYYFSYLPLIFTTPLSSVDVYF